MKIEDELRQFEVPASESPLLKPLLDFELTPFGELRRQDGEAKLSLYNTWTPAVNEFMQERGIHWLQVSYVGMKGAWKGKDLEFLRQMPFLEGLSLSYRDAIVLEPIYSLRRLKKLLLAVSCDCPVDFSAFAELERLEFPWRPKRDSFSKAVRLRYLVLEAYKRKNMDALRTLPKLEHLDLYSSPVEDIRGIGSLTSLSRLRLAHCRCLQDISPFADLKQLKRLELQNLPKVRDLTSLGECSALEDLELDLWKNEIDLSFIQQLPNLKTLICSQATVKSLKPLKQHPSLERVAVLAVGDRDLSPLLTLPCLQKVSFWSKPENAEMKRTMQARGLWIQRSIRE